MKRGTCICSCGGIVLDSSDTIIISRDARFVSCRACYRVWNYDYAYAKQPDFGSIMLVEAEEVYHVRQIKKDNFL